MNDVIKILIVDDNPADRQLIKNELEKVFIMDMEEVENRRELDEAIRRWDFDIVVTDFKLGWISGLDVLANIKSRDPNLPVIMFTSGGDEETAVKAMKIGLDDYIIKSTGHFNRIPVTINRIFKQIRETDEKKRMQEQLRRNEQRIKELMDNAIMGYYQTTPNGEILYVNNTLLEMLGYETLEDLQKRNLEEKGFEPDYNRDHFKQMMEEYGEVDGLEATWLRKDGQHLYVRENARVRRDNSGNILYYEGSVENITDVIQSRKLHDVIRNISRIMVADVSLDRFYQLIIEKIRDIIKYGELYISMRDEEKGILVIEKSSNGEQVISKEIPDKRSLEYYLLNHHDSLLLNYKEFSKIKEKHNLVENRPFSQWMGACIKGEAGNMGVLVAVHKEEAAHYTELERSILEYIGAQLGIYIEKKKAADNLTRAKRKAEESDRLKTYFLANVSHELRTPLNGIIGFSRMITDSTEASKEMRHYGDLIFQNSTNLYNIIDNLIHFSRLESGELQSERNSVDIYAYLNDFFEDFIDTHPKPSLFYELDKDRRYEKFIIETDQDLLGKVLENIMQNAFSFTDDGKIKLGFRIEETQNQVVFYVSDTGKGIPKEGQYKIFQDFVTLEDPFMGEYQGTGMGLPLCYKILKKLGGTIWLDSEPEKGSTFYFTLPIKTEASEPGGEISLSDKKILIIEDDTVNYQLLETILLPYNCDLVWAKDGESGRKVFEDSTDIDLVLLDIFLPAINGDVLLREFKNKRKDIPVIVITAYALDNLQKDIAKAGADAFITKPLRKHELINKIEQAFGKLINE